MDLVGLSDGLGVEQQKPGVQGCRPRQEDGAAIG